MKVLTLNLRHHRDRWNERLPLVVEVLQTYRPDIVCFQEVWMPIQQAHMILNLVDDTSLQLRVLPKQGVHGNEGIAVASRYRINSHKALDLPGGERVSQRLLVDVEGELICIANTHLHDKPYNNESIRLPQMQALLEWLAEVSHPIVLTGDMNARPGSETIAEAKSKFQSAYEAAHGSEPVATFPTPLVIDSHSDQVGVIDYIFFSGDSLRVTDAAIVADNGHPEDDTLYPSDHYGILATLEFGS